MSLDQELAIDRATELLKMPGLRKVFREKAREATETGLSPQAGSEAPKKNREGSPGTEVRKGASLAEHPHPLAFRQSVGGQARHYEQGVQNPRGGPCSLDHAQAEDECPEEADTTQELPSPAASPDLHSQKERQAPTPRNPDDA